MVCAVVVPYSPQSQSALTPRSNSCTCSPRWSQVPLARSADPDGIASGVRADTERARRSERRLEYRRGMGTFVGPLLAGVVVAGTGSVAASLLVAVTFAGAAAAVTGIRFERAA